MFNFTSNPEHYSKKEYGDKNHYSDQNLIENRTSSSLKIKICGITSKEDLKAAENNGADLIGFINVERSSRYVDLEKIKVLSRSLNDENKGVLVLEPENVQEALDKVNNSEIKNIQLHSLSPLEIKELMIRLSYDDQKSDCGKDYRVIRVIGLNEEELSRDQIQKIEAFSRLCTGVLFDYHWQGKTGGTGREIPLKNAIKAAELVRRKSKNLEIFLAGGMSLTRIQREGRIIKEIFDFVDFNSSLEEYPGKKNQIKIKNAIETVNKLDSTR